MAFYEVLVALGDGLMLGKFMLQGWKNMHPEEHYFEENVDLYEHMNDPAYIAKREAFEMVRESDRPAWALVSPGDPPTLQGKPAREG